MTENISNDIPTAKAVEVIDCEATAVMQDNDRGSDRELNESGLRTFLSSRAWPNGLQEAVINTTKKMPIRFVICDDSGSMMTTDGALLRRCPDGADRLARF